MADHKKPGRGVHWHLCGCTNAFQDATNPDQKRGVRLHNNKSGLQSGHCTACGKENQYDHAVVDKLIKKYAKGAPK